MQAQQRGQALRGGLPLALFGLFGMGAKCRGLLQLHAHVQAQQPQRPGDQERHAPAPIEHLRRSHAHVQGGHGGGAGDVATQRAELQPAAHQAAIAVGGVFGNEGGRATVFAAGGKSLQHARQQQQCRRPQANALVGRNQSDTEGAQRHQDHRGGQDFLAPVAVAERSEDHAADRPHQKGHGEGGEGRDQLCGRVACREEHLAQRHRQIAVHAEVEPLHRIAERRSADGPAQHAAVHHGDLIQLQLAAAFEPAKVRTHRAGIVHLWSP